MQQGSYDWNKCKLLEVQNGVDSFWLEVRKKLDTLNLKKWKILTGVKANEEEWIELDDSLHRKNVEDTQLR